MRALRTEGEGEGGGREGEGGGEGGGRKREGEKEGGEGGGGRGRAKEGKVLRQHPLHDQTTNKLEGGPAKLCPPFCSMSRV